MSIATSNSTKFSKEQAISFIQEESKLAWLEFQTIFSCKEMPTIDIIYNKTSTAGWAFYSGRVEFNLRFCMSEGEKYIRTIRHELAHIIQFRLFPNAKQAHGPEFRYILGSITQDFSRCHSYNVAAAKAIKVKILPIDLISAEEM